MPKRVLQGTVTSTLNENTLTVSVERRFKHPVLKKTIRRSKKYRAHDDNNAHKLGDIVKIRETVPISKTKRWEVIELKRKSINRNQGKFNLKVGRKK